MKKTKDTAAQKPDGKQIVLTIPTELHTNIRIEQIREHKKTLHEKVLEYLALGFEAAHNGYSGNKVKSSK